MWFTVTAKLPISSAGKIRARAWEMQRDFLAGHLVQWIGPLRDKIHEKSKHPYYRALADLAVEFTGSDLVALEDLLGPSEGNPAPQFDTIGA